jgi:hypothetical protein
VLKGKTSGICDADKNCYCSESSIRYAIDPVISCYNNAIIIIIII